MFEKIKSFHFVGIGGVGMGAIAEILIRRGYQVSGSDLNSSPLVELLRGLGARIMLGHQATNVAQAEAVIFSSAISQSNPELATARKRGLPPGPSSGNAGRVDEIQERDHDLWHPRQNHNFNYRCFHAH